MKKQILTVAALLISGFISAQDIPKSQVPSVVSNQFEKTFPNATDVEWEMKRDTYKVDFEVSNIDHAMWYTSTGELIKHKEDITVADLPKAVSDKINTSFSGYSIDDLERISVTGGDVIYKMELNATLQQDWDVTFNAEGKILSQKAD